MPLSLKMQIYHNMKSGFFKNLKRMIKNAEASTNWNVFSFYEPEMRRIKTIGLFKRGNFPLPLIGCMLVVGDRIPYKRGAKAIVATLIRWRKQAHLRLWHGEFTKHELDTSSLLAPFCLWSERIQWAKFFFLSMRIEINVNQAIYINLLQKKWLRSPHK